MSPHTTGFLLMILFAKGEVGKAGLLDGLVANDQLAEPFLPGPFHVDHQHIARWSTGQPQILYIIKPKKERIDMMVILS